jgi:NAD-dependent SIR2 family protein deacetylase
MIENIQRFHCDTCGKTHDKWPTPHLPHRWTTQGDKHSCPHCSGLQGKRPRNLSGEEIRRSLMTFPMELLRKQVKEGYDRG